MKKYENKRNVIGDLIKTHRESHHYSKVKVCRLLELHAVYINPNDLNKMEQNRMIIKDFELIGLCKVLEIEFQELTDAIE